MTAMCWKKPPDFSLVFKTYWRDYIYNNNSFETNAEKACSILCFISFIYGKLKQESYLKWRFIWNTEFKNDFKIAKFSINFFQIFSHADRVRYLLWKMCRKIIFNFVLIVCISIIHLYLSLFLIVNLSILLSLAL